MSRATTSEMSTATSSAHRLLNSRHHHHHRRRPRRRRLDSASHDARARFRYHSSRHPHRIAPYARAHATPTHMPTPRPRSRTSTSPSPRATAPKMSSTWFRKCAFLTSRACLVARLGDRARALASAHRCATSVHNSARVCASTSAASARGRGRMRCVSTSKRRRAANDHACGLEIRGCQRFKQLMELYVPYYDICFRNPAIIRYRFRNSNSSYVLISHSMPSVDCGWVKYG